MRGYRTGITSIVQLAAGHSQCTGMLGGAFFAEHACRGREVANQIGNVPCLVLFARPRISGGAWFLARDEKRARAEINIGGVCGLWRR